MISEVKIKSKNSKVKLGNYPLLDFYFLLLNYDEQRPAAWQNTRNDIDGTGTSFWLGTPGCGY